MMNQNLHHYPYQSKRTAVTAKHGMVATSQPLAAQAGLDMLKQGGNAVDAAIATAACLTVVEPTSNGIGGDAFAIVWLNHKMHGLNASGVAPEAISIDKVKALGHDTMPKFGLTPVTVPGAPSAWVALSKRFGKLPLTTCLAPAIEYAREGFPVSPTVAEYWGKGAKGYAKIFTDAIYDEWFKTFTNDKEPPKAHELWTLPNHANTLEAIAQTNGKAFYEGNIADQIDAFSRKHNGFIRKSDLIKHQVSWIDPISVRYRGYDVWELPPNGQGLVASQAFAMMNHLNVQAMDAEENVHHQIEAIKLAFADAHTYLTDLDHMPYTPAELLNEQYIKSRVNRIGKQAKKPSAGTPPKGGTVYLATADKDGNMVSFIQSNYMGFGSGIVVPNTGIALQNRGHTFSLDKTHANALKPEKKTYHTIIPAFLTKDGIPIGPFGVMGGFMQPQGHLQVMMQCLDNNLNPQAALDAPRWQWMKGLTVEVEPTMDQILVDALKKRGHDVVVTQNIGSFGRGQIIWRNPKTGVLIGGTEMRADGSIAAW